MSNSDIDPAVLAELAPTGTLRAGINLSNFLLVTGEAENGDPVGVSPDVAAEIARRLGVAVQFVTYPSPGALADASDHDEWDIGNIGAEPQRAETITFTAAYSEIEATYLVPAGSPIKIIADVDRPGVRVAVKDRAAYGLWLENNLQFAELVRTETIDASFDVFVDQRLDVLAGLRPRLISDVARLSGARILSGQFSAVQQAVGTPQKNVAAAIWLRDVVEDLKSSGFIAKLIKRHNVKGLSVAPLA
ncbi:ABC transporter substrate-binding protein [Loktanella sp. 3ANDIMAR09]|uniref:transporter substrate-binding domain-containing protein n=1 Tax=Loktanella sp. 3ANDIMAR09 TaxID=1225657 RepID=UPI0006F517EB|nr:transporter substrate-binding domain-containing protein [Loktanella sp. 3ANDIMAR09]KQI67890.1 ABC transporter substrate-binding protein [Loktanella sp. 3ANDIMAR09]